MRKIKYWWALKLYGDLFLLEDSCGKTKERIMKEWNLKSDKRLVRIRIEEVRRKK